jgi:hypothetical protein
MRRLVRSLALGLTVAACSPAATAAPSVSAPASTSPAATTVVTVTASPSASPRGASPSPSAAAVVRDDSLVAVLPPDIDGNPVTIEGASFAEAATDPAFAGNIASAAFAIVTSPVDLASGVVATPVAGRFGDAFFQSWRETYNEGACSQAGGVATNAETTLGGRTVYITTCAGGLTVYHAWVEERGVIVSLFSLGAGRYGERLMRDLRP